jgi:putative flippase GtrA
MHHMLRSLLRKHTRLTKTATIGLVLAGLGFGLFYVLVFHLGVDKLKASMLLSPCMTALSLVLNRRLAWSDRCRTKKRDSCLWSVKWAVMFTISQGSFALLTGFFGLPTLLVRGGSGAPLSYISYKLNDVFVFPEKTNDR